MKKAEWLPPSENEGKAQEWRDALKGFAGAIVLTLAAFWLTIGHAFGKAATFAMLAALALIQIAWHFRYFLHIDLQKSHRDDLQLILFTGLIVLLMVAGTLWILFNQHSRMG